jgi:hypothetical protein
VSLEVWRRSLLARLSDALRPKGFRRKGSTFTRDKPDVVHILNLQSSTKSTQDLLVVTINVAVYSRALEEKGACDGPAGVWTAHWSERIGCYTPLRQDVWWEICNADDCERAADDLVQLTMEKAIPQLDELATTEALVALWRSGRSPGLTKGQRDRYLALLTDR